MGAYRIHGGGAWSGIDEVEQLEQVIEFYEKMNANLGFKYDEIIKVMISKHYDDLAAACKRSGDHNCERLQRS
jgi:hypothetical protein